MNFLVGRRFYFLLAAFFTYSQSVKQVIDVGSLGGTRTVIIVFITLPPPRRPRRRPHLHSITETRVRVHQKYPGIQPSMPDAGQGDNKGWRLLDRSATALLGI